MHIQRKAHTYFWLKVSDGRNKTDKWACSDDKEGKNDNDKWTGNGDKERFAVRSLNYNEYGNYHSGDEDKNDL